MNKKTLAALKGSIEKWEKIVAGTGGDDGADNCPLCQLFNNDETEEMCAGCPVAKKTGLDGCSGTPYPDWGEHFRGILRYPFVADTKEKVAAAEAELAFLRSLLPRAS